MNIENIKGVQLHEYESLSDDIRKVLKALDNPQIKLYEVWIIPDEEFYPEVRVKYGYFIYPSYALITALNKEDRIQINYNSIVLPNSNDNTTGLTHKEISVFEQAIEDKPNKRSFFDDMFDDTDRAEQGNGILDDITQDDASDLLVKTLVGSELENKAELIRKRLEEQYLTYRNLSAETIYNILTSADHHKSVTYLNACKCGHGATSYIRMTELQKLFDFEVPPIDMENFGIDLGRMIIYFHIDTGRGGFENVHFNRYLYNNASLGEMKFYDKVNNYSSIDYNDWEGRLSDKTVLVFGYNQSKVADADLLLDCTEPPYVFLGSHESAALPIDEGFRLNLCHSYDLPI